MTDNKVRWGILGCGKIANKFAADLQLVKDAELIAIASRDHKRGKTFADEFGVKNIFDNYEDLVKGASIDVIYVATPHGLHYEHVMLCINHNKAVLCEKAFAINTKQAQAMIALAKEKEVFLMEAFWTKFLPQYRKIIELIDSGSIGEIKIIQADFGFKPMQPLAHRFNDPQLGGGSLLDIGIYPVFLAQSLLGTPLEVQAMMIPYPSGVDEQCIINLKFKGGVLATLSSSFAVETPTEATIIGTTGRIHMRNRFHNAISRIELVRGTDELLEEVEVYRADGYGYQFEAQHVCDCIQRGLKESPVMTHNDTLSLMETLDAIRKAAGIHYPVD